MAKPWAGVEGRVLIAPDDDPLEPTPTWVRVDDPTGEDFPAQFVAGYDVENGKQSLLDQTETGTGTVYIHDNKFGLFDPRNTSSPYYGKLVGKQILLQLFDPVREAWEPQFQGTIDEPSYDINGDAVDANGDPIDASIQLNCVDIFDYANGFGLTPGLAGVKPPVGAEDGVYYAATIGTVDDRILEVLADMGIDESRYIVFSGNNALQAAKYDPDEAALSALRDAADAEAPFIANLYVDRFGRLVFHGRYGRWDATAVAADAGVDRWDFHEWLAGDGKAIRGDSSIAQLRELAYSTSRPDLINVATCYPANMDAARMPSQVFADTTSITDYGEHAAPPMSDLLVAKPIYDSNHSGPSDRYEECLAFAELLVKNQKDPVEPISALNFKTVHPLDHRAETTWALLSQVDVSDTITLKVGYPGGTGFTGDDVADKHFVEGRQLQVRPLDPGYDYVSLDLAVSPFVWSADTHNVFPVRV